MQQALTGLTALVLMLGVVAIADAHHPPQMDNCYALTFTARIERVEWRNPHVELTVLADDGERHVLVWLNPQQLGLAGVDRDTLQAGDDVIVTVGTREDGEDGPMLLAAITKNSDGWEWSQTPQGC
jgi:hypothetical protein